MGFTDALFSHFWTSYQTLDAFTVWWSSSGSLSSELSLWIRWRELGGEREERECSGLLADRAYGEPAGLSSLRGDPTTEGRTHPHIWSLVKIVLVLVLLHFGIGVWRKCEFTVDQRQKSLCTSHWLCTGWQAENKSGSDRMKDRWGDSRREARVGSAGCWETGESSRAGDKLI